MGGNLISNEGGGIGDLWICVFVESGIRVIGESCNRVTVHLNDFNFLIIVLELELQLPAFGYSTPTGFCNFYGYNF